MGENVPYTSYLSQKEQFHKKMLFLQQLKNLCVQVQGVENAPFEKNPG
jgi:hypothetical protein